MGTIVTLKYEKLIAENVVKLGQKRNETSSREAIVRKKSISYGIVIPALIVKDSLADVSEVSIRSLTLRFRVVHFFKLSNIFRPMYKY